MDLKCPKMEAMCIGCWLCQPDLGAFRILEGMDVGQWATHLVGICSLLVVRESKNGGNLVGTQMSLGSQV